MRTQAAGAVSSRLALCALACVACGAKPARPLTETVGVSPNQTCPLATPRRTPAPLALASWLGRIGARSWVLGIIGSHYVLAALADDGTLAITRLPQPSTTTVTTAIDGARLWLVGRALRGSDEQTLRAVDLDRPQPKVHPATSLHEHLAPASSFAIGTTRGLFFAFADRRGFQLWDRRRGHAVARSVDFDLYAQGPAQIRCIADCCFALGVLGIADERRLTLARFDPISDAAELVSIADDPIGDYLAVPDGELTPVLWTDSTRRGVSIRALASDGHPLDERFDLATEARTMMLVRSAGRPRVAFRSARGWSIATLSADHRRLDDKTALGIPNRLLMTAATTFDGTLATGFDGNSETAEQVGVPRDDDPSSEDLDDKSRTSYAVFVPTGDHPGPPIDVMPRPSYRRPSELHGAPARRTGVRGGADVSAA